MFWARDEFKRERAPRDTDSSWVGSGVRISRCGRSPPRRRVRVVEDESCRPPRKSSRPPESLQKTPLCDLQEPSERSRILAVPRLNLLCSMLGLMDKLIGGWQWNGITVVRLNLEENQLVWIAHRVRFFVGCLDHLQNGLFLKQCQAKNL